MAQDEPFRTAELKIDKALSGAIYLTLNDMGLTELPESLANSYDYRR